MQQENLIFWMYFVFCEIYVRKAAGGFRMLLETAEV